MLIKKASVYHVRLPMKFVFKTGFGEIPWRDTVIIKLVDDKGRIGYGESAALSAPIYLSETIQTCLHILKDFLLPDLVNKETNLEDFVEKHKFIRGHNIAKFGLECALFMLKSQEENKPVSDLVGGTRKVIEIGESIGMQPDILSTLKVIDKRLKEGFRRIKIKIEPGWDIELLKAIRKEFPDISLMVDANSAYGVKDIDHLRKLDEFNLLMIEQPLGFDDIIDHAKLQAKLKTPICLDESIISVDDARKALEIGACKIINVKPGRVGGLIETVKINEEAKKWRIPLWCGGMLETGIAKAYNLAATSLSEFDLPADISPTRIFYEEDLTKPDLDIRDGCMVKVPSEPGLGFEVLEENITKFQTESFEIK